MVSSRTWACSGAISMMAFTAGAIAQPVSEIVGLDDLIARLGNDAPSGLGVVVSQVEAAVEGEYGPNQAMVEFEGKTFKAMSGPPGESAHASVVAKHMYGKITSIAPDVGLIYLYEANHWVQSGFLKTGSPGSVPPIQTPGGVKLFNNSWIGKFGTAGIDDNCLRRADYVILRDDVIITSGVANGGDGWPLLSHLFNGIAVGCQHGSHAFADTLADYDGPGRMKPEIVAPESVTSFSTPVFNAAGSLMVETARTWPDLESNPNADRSDVLKAVLLAGATHEDEHDGEWSNNAIESGPDRGITDRPLDEVVGAGTVNVNRSHYILTGGEQDGSKVVPDEASAIWSGWDSVPLAPEQSKYWRIEVPEPADEISILVTWHREIATYFTGWALADLDLVLWRVDDGGELASLVGDAGLGYFAAGNVVSQSAVDNIEHLYVLGVEPGEYVIELARVDSLGAYPTWDAAIAWLFPKPPAIPEDVTGDGIVDVLDLLAVLGAWGECGGCPEDITGDGVVDVLDLLAVLAAWD